MKKGDKLNIELAGGPPWGFRLGGGADFGCPLEIAKLRKKSKAFEAGLAEGDVVTSIDHHDVTSKSHGEAMKIIELAGTVLKLQIIKGVGPSADLMANTMIINQSDGLDMVVSPAIPSSQQPVEAMVVRSREPSISRSFTEPTRERSVSKTITVIPSSSHKVEPIENLKKRSDPWTVDVTTYEFANAAIPAASSSFQTHSLAPQAEYKQAPPTSPKPKFKASSLPRSMPSSSNIDSCPILPSWGAPPTDPSLKHVWKPENQAELYPSMATKPAPMFRVAKVDVKTRPDKWQPTAVHNVDYHDSRHRFNSDGMMSSPQPSVTSLHSHREGHTYSPAVNTSPRPLSVPIPEPPPLPSAMSPKKPGNHIPGMVNPLICDDSQGDFGANPIIRPNTKNSAVQAQSQKKIYSDSTFYDAPGMEYPTIHEQVALCKEIASFLESGHNKRSKGGRMFMKRKQRSEEWSMDSQGQGRELPQSYNYDLQATEPMKTPYHPMQRRHFGYSTVRHHPDPIKSKLSAAELEQMQHNQNALCKHDSLPPNVAFDINQALSQSKGKAAQIFEKRKQRAEKYVVDENTAQNWKNHAPTSFTNQIEDPVFHPQQPYVSPWQAAMDGRLDMGFHEKPNLNPHRAPAYNSPQINRMMPSSLQEPLHVITDNQQRPAAAPLNVKYKSFKSVNPPSAGERMSAYASTGAAMPKARTRLDQMLSDESASEATHINSSNPRTTLFNNQGMMYKPDDSRIPSHGNQSFTPPAHSSTLHANSQQASNSFTLNLKRPKDYMGQGGNINMTRSYPNSSVSAF